MNAQQEWKAAYNIWRMDLIDYKATQRMTRYRREALLERRLEAAQRKLEIARLELCIIAEQAQRAALVQDRSVGIIKQTLNVISKNAQNTLKEIA